MPATNSVTMVIGIPGSGKSYFGVQQILDYKGSRPIFTNIPVHVSALQLYVERKYRRPAPDVFVVTQEHFERFTGRLSRVKEAQESITRQEPGLDPAEVFERAKTTVAETLGPVQTWGPEADWIPEKAILHLDELQNWFPSKGYREEAPEIQAYFTMHRHLKHTVFVYTQRARLCSMSIRGMTSSYIFMHEKSRIPFALGLRLPFKWFQGLEYPSELVREDGLEPPPKVHPVEVHYARPNAERFALYESFSLTEKESEVDAGDKGSSGGVPAKRKRRLWPWLAAVAAVGFLISLGASSSPPVPAAQSQGATERRDATAAPGASDIRSGGVEDSEGRVAAPKARTANVRQVVLAVPEGFDATLAVRPSEALRTSILSGVMVGKGVIVNGTVYVRPGGVYEGAILLSVEKRVSFWTCQGRTMIWSVGGAPQFMR